MTNWPEWPKPNWTTVVCKQTPDLQMMPFFSYAHTVWKISQAALEDSMFAYDANRACNLGHRSYASVVTESWSLASHYTGLSHTHVIIRNRDIPDYTEWRQTRHETSAVHNSQSHGLWYTGDGVDIYTTVCDVNFGEQGVYYTGLQGVYYSR